MLRNPAPTRPAPQARGPQRPKAYNVENFPNKFTANYLFLVNATERDLPRVNQASLARKPELDAEWAKLQACGTELLQKSIPAFNKSEAEQ
ncbi:MAG: hypothetical protein MUC97_14405 [Bernardetiaceae bacterium]|nr:hypothetical protein [Bernardetiaceae bacterium]